MTLFWLLLNTLFRLGIASIVVWKLIALRDNFRTPERIGMGLAGGSVILTVPQLWAESSTPFELWASAIFSMGIFIYFCGRMTRHYQHRWRNDEANRQAARHLEGRR